MSAIKLPAKVVCTTSGLNILIDADGVTICNTGGSSGLAVEIVVALNAHDALVAELVRLQDCVGSQDRESITALLESTKP